MCAGTAVVATPANITGNAMEDFATSGPTTGETASSSCTHGPASSDGGLLQWRLARQAGPSPLPARRNLPQTSDGGDQPMTFGGAHHRMAAIKYPDRGCCAADGVAATTGIAASEPPALSTTV